MKAVEFGAAVAEHIAVVHGAGGRFIKLPGGTVVAWPLRARAATVNFGCPVRSDGWVAAAQICRSLIRARVGRLASPKCRRPYA